jgi:sigma-E factor negative regulatory protein RseA
MTQEISSLMDGELAAPEAEQAIRSIAGEEHKATWYLYHCIGDSMRGQAPRSLERPAALASLQAQPTVLAPRRAKPAVYARVALAAAASVATIGVVGWIGTQGGAPAVMPVAKVSSGIQPVANQVRGRDAVQALDVQAYLAAHRQMPSPELYRPVNNRAPASAR